MESRGTRSIFVAALCAGVAMVGLSVHGLMGVDSDLQRSAFAAQQLQMDQPGSVHVGYKRGGDCHQSTTPGLSERT
jgi:hypothetical protein